MGDLRQRNTFKLSTEDDDDGRILDEQEQEELINNVQREAVESDKRNIIILQALMGISIAFQFYFLVKLLIAYAHSDGTRDWRLMATPVCRLFGNLQLVIHWAPLFALLNIVLQIWDLINLVQDPSKSILLPQDALYFAAPVLSAVCRRNYSQTFWWSLPGLVCICVTLSKSWMEDTRLQLKELEKLRYKAKSA